MERSRSAFILIMVMGLFFAPAAGAHKVTIFAWAEGDMVYTESKFSGGKMVKDGKVEVFDKNGALLIEGRTSDNGEFSFKAPQRVDLKIVLTAGMGHQNSWSLTAAELGGGNSQAPPLTPSEVKPRQAPVSQTGAPALTTRDVEAIVARQLEQKLQPLTRMIAASQDKRPTPSDIIGGVGYIIGLVGLGAYVRYRRDRRQS